MQRRASISNLVISLVLIFFLFILALILKARYRLPSQDSADQMSDNVPKAIPLAIPVEPKIAVQRAYKSGSFWVLPQPVFGPSRANEPDTYHISNGPKEDIFVLYGVDGAQISWTHASKLMEQSAFFGGIPPSHVLDTGSKALNWVAKLLTENKFIVYTQWTRVPDTERFYAFIRVEQDGKQEDLGEMLVRRGYASPTGTAPKAMPEAGRTPENYRRELGRALSQAKAEQTGLWAQ